MTTAADVLALLAEWDAAAKHARARPSPGAWEATGKAFAQVIRVVRESGPVEWRGVVWRVAPTGRPGVVTLRVSRAVPEKLGGFVSEKVW